MDCKWVEMGICSVDTHDCNVFCHLCPRVPVQIWVQMAAAWLCPSPSLFFFFSSSRQFPHAPELSQCLWCSASHGTQELLISSQRKVEKGFYFHSKSLIFITWRTMSCIIKIREPDRQFSPFLKHLLCCFLVFKHNHKISNL